jgi:GntR family transcriptional regulator
MIAVVKPVFGRGPLPRYAQLADVLRGRIERGIWGPGTRLPSLEQLIEEFSLARVTVRQAIDMLHREGLVLPQQGRGTFVTARPARPRAIKMQTSLRELAQVYRHDKPKLTLLEESEAMPVIGMDEGLPAPRYHFARRVHSRDNIAYCVISIYLDDRVFRRAPRRFRRETVIPVLLDLEVDIAHAHQSVTISAADTEVAAHLDVPVSSPVALVRRVCCSPDRTVLYVGEVTYRGDFVRFEMDLKP